MEPATDHYWGNGLPQLHRKVSVSGSGSGSGSGSVCVCNGVGVLVAAYFHINVLDELTNALTIGEYLLGDMTYI
jgi:hypothetical protein